MKRFIIGLIVLLVLIGGGFALTKHNNPAMPGDQTTGDPNKTLQTANKSNDEFNKHQYSIDDPASIWVIVNKKRPLNPKDYVPADLITPDLPLRVPGNESMQMRKITADAISKLFDAAKADGAPLMVSSGYRPYSYQVSLYNHYVQTQGQSVADTQSARPGYSEHQTGLAVDVEPKDQQCDVDQCFGDLPAGKWIAANAYKYGFVIRYPKGKDHVTGYEYEPWHIRYVGIDLATEMHNQHIDTLEQFFGLPDAPDY